jgi:hypothetical protein
MNGFGEKPYHGSFSFLLVFAERKFHLIANFHDSLLFFLAVFWGLLNEKSRCMTTGDG